MNEDNSHHTKAILKTSELLQLHIAEYNALRAEQRQRLDSQNKVIQVLTVMIAAAASAIIALKARGIDNWTISTILLIMPFLFLPFALTQQNEEMMVRRIGSYIVTLRALITESADERYWRWEAFHTSTISWPLYITGFFRQALVSIFALISLLAGLWIGWKPTPGQWALCCADVLLIILYGMIALLSKLARFGCLN